jgi:epoxide hydrolase 4
MPNSELTVRHGYAQLMGVRLHYAEVCGGEDLVILLHGFPEFWYSWRHQLAALGKHFHVVAPDMRGYNLSDKPQLVEHYRLDELVKDVVGLIEYFGASRAAIVGHDWGAAVAWAVAQTYPERVSGLAVLQVPPAAAWRANITVKQLLKSWYMFFFQLPRIPEWAISRREFRALDRVFTETVVRKGTFNETDVAQYKEALRQPGAVTAAVNYYRANVGRLLFRSDKDICHEGDMTRNDKKRVQTRIRVPTLFIFGERDFAILPSTVRGVEQYVQAPFQEVRIEDSGHWVQNEAFAEVNTALLEFLLTIDKG